MNERAEKYILTINAGSSSIKFALFSSDDLTVRTLSGRIDRIGLAGSVFAYTDASHKEVVEDMAIVDTEAAIKFLDTFLTAHIDFGSVVAIGHRVVHGMRRKEHAVVNAELLEELKRISMIDPEHLPFEIALIEMFQERHGAILQVACFDTVFHRDMPRVAEMLPIPRKFYEKGIQRYGFHGLSCAYLTDELRRLDPSRAEERVVILHLGNGVSVTAVRGGKSADTSMGFTPAGGVPMSSRSGDLDPGALLHIMKSEGLSHDELNHLINHESGLLGVSETSSDMHDLLNSEAADERARDAVDLFCYEIKKRIGATAAALGGVETLIFSGGMGEHAPTIRARICEGLEFLGITLDPLLNQQSDAIISASSGGVCVRVIHTDEEIMIARIVHGFISK